MDLQEMQWEVVDGIDVAQERNHWQILVNMVMNLPIPHIAWNFLPW
jgi:hypothetical protein